MRRKDRENIWHPFTQMAEWEKDAPLIIERGEGNYLIDTDGRRYFDGVSSLWVNLFGHRRREIDEAIRSQLDRLAHSTFLGLHVPAVELSKDFDCGARRIQPRVLFDNGSTAMEIAIEWPCSTGNKKAAGKADVHDAYRGVSRRYDRAVSPEASTFHKNFQPLLFTTHRIPTPHCYRCPYGMARKSCGLVCAARMEEEVRRYRQELAAFIVEPLVQGAAGMLMMPEGYLARLREVTRECGLLLICDEVATGFGRTGTMFACEQEGISPDIMAVAKGLTGGYLPLAATLTTKEVYDAFLGRYEEFKAFFHGHSYTANPLGCAAALATLSIFEEQGVLKHVASLSGIMAEELAKIERRRCIGDIRQKGLMVGIEIVEDRHTKAPFPPEKKVGQKVVRKVRRRGLSCAHWGCDRLMPPLSSTEDEIRHLVGSVGWAIDSVL